MGDPDRFVELDMLESAVYFLVSVEDWCSRDIIMVACKWMQFFQEETLFSRAIVVGGTFIVLLIL